MTSRDTEVIRFIAIFAFIFCAIVALATAVSTGNRRIILSMSIMVAVFVVIFLIALFLLR